MTPSNIREENRGRHNTFFLLQRNHNWTLECFSQCYAMSGFRNWWKKSTRNFITMISSCGTLRNCFSGSVEKGKKTATAKRQSVRVYKMARLLDVWTRSRKEVYFSLAKFRPTDPGLSAYRKHKENVRHKSRERVKRGCCDLYRLVKHTKTSPTWLREPKEGMGCKQRIKYAFQCHSNYGSVCVCGFPFSYRSAGIVFMRIFVNNFPKTHTCKQHIKLKHTLLWFDVFLFLQVVTLGFLFSALFVDQHALFYFDERDRLALGCRRMISSQKPFVFQGSLRYKK